MVQYIIPSLLIRASEMEINAFLDVGTMLYHFWNNNNVTRNPMYLLLSQFLLFHYSKMLVNLLEY